MVSIPEVFTFGNANFPYARFIVRKYGILFEKIMDVGEKHVWVKCISPGKGYGRENILLAKKLLVKRVAQKEREKGDEKKT